LFGYLKQLFLLSEITLLAAAAFLYIGPRLDWKKNEHDE
jgi:hypothetical protein